MKAPSSAAVAHTGSSDGSSRFVPAMLEPIIAPCMPSSRTARRSSSAARSGACIGSVAIPMKRSGCAFTSSAIWSFCSAEVATASAGS